MPIHVPSMRVQRSVTMNSSTRRISMVPLISGRNDGRPYIHHSMTYTSSTDDLESALEDLVTLEGGSDSSSDDECLATSQSQGNWTLASVESTALHRKRVLAPLLVEPGFMPAGLPAVPGKDCHVGNPARDLAPSATFLSRASKHDAFGHPSAQQLQQLQHEDCRVSSLLKARGRQRMVRRLGTGALESLAQNEGLGGFHYLHSLGKVVSSNHSWQLRECMEVQTGRMLECQIITKTPEAWDSRRLCALRMEHVLHKTLPEHPNVASAGTMYEDAEHLFLARERCEGGSLRGLVRALGLLKEEYAAAMFWQMLSAVAHCHKNGVLLGRLTLDSFHVAEALCLRRAGSRGRLESELFLKRIPTLKLWDFSSATLAGTQTTAQTLGRRPFGTKRATLSGAGRSTKSDVWSLGVILCEMLSGEDSLSENPKECRATVEQRGLNMVGQPWAHVSRDAKDMVSRLVQLNPDARPSILELQLHPWLAHLAFQDNLKGRRSSLSPATFGSSGCLRSIPHMPKTGRCSRGRNSSFVRTDTWQGVLRIPRSSSSKQGQLLLEGERDCDSTSKDSGTTSWKDLGITRIGSYKRDLNLLRI